MEDSKKEPNDESKGRLAERLSEATSDETLRDLEESEKETGADSTTYDPSPSPDGQLDEQDEVKDNGPM